MGPPPPRAPMQKGLIARHNAGPRRKQVVDFFVDRCCVIERHFLFALVEFVLRLLRHRKWTWNRHLDQPAGIGSEELKVSYLYGMVATNPPNGARHRVGMTASVKRRAGVLQVHAVQCGGTPVR